MTGIPEIIIALLVLAVLIWGGDRLLALLPGYERLKQAARIIAIVAVSLWVLSLIASFFGVAMPWGTSVGVHRHR